MVRKTGPGCADPRLSVQGPGIAWRRAGGCHAGCPCRKAPRRGRCLHRPARFAPPQGFRDDARTARRQVWQAADAYRVVPACGRIVGRAISPAAWGLRYRRVSGTMRASSPTDAGQGPAGLFRIPMEQGGNAPLPSAPCGASTVRFAVPASHGALKHACALRPSNLLRLAFSSAGGARLRSPLQGRLLSRRWKGSPVRGAGGVSRLRGAAPGSANILPGHRKPSRPCGITEPRGAALTQNRSVTPLPSPAGVNARPTI